MTFLRNSWYIAAWSNEVTEQPLGRRILDIPIVLYRALNDSAVALFGVCPHRFAPLRLGRLIGDAIECPYHGLRFDRDGKCVLNPHGRGARPAALNIKHFPLVERHGACWIWMGDAERADEASIPPLDFIDDIGGRTVVRGHIHSNAYYELLTDNIMDLGHVDFVHSQSLGSPSFATARAEVRVSRDGNTIRCDRWMPDDLQSPMLETVYERKGRVDAWGDVTWYPAAVMKLSVGMTAVGAPRQEGRDIPSAHIMTPETKGSTHYFWASARDFKVGDDEYSRQFLEAFTNAFVNEDMRMVMAQQEEIGSADLNALKPALLSTDAGPVQVRRALTQLIAAEREAGPA